MQGLRVLIVDDMANMRSTLRRICTDLEALSCDIASNGDEALHNLRLRHYDVVLCDYNLGDGRDGQQVLEEARHRGFVPPGCAFLMITAESDLPMVLGAVEGRPDDYLVKPIVKDVLLLRLNRTLTRKRELRELEQIIARGDIPAAMTLCDTLAAQLPAQAREIERIKVEMCIDHGKLDLAESICRETLAKSPLPWAQFGLARVMALQGRDADAREEFEGLLRTSPWCLEAYDWLAKISERQGRTENACELLQAAVALSDKSVRRQRRLGEIAVRSGQMAVAERALRAAIRVGRSSCFAAGTEYVELTKLLTEQGQGNQVLALLREGRKVLQDQPAEAVQICTAQVQAYRSRGADVDARAALDDALALGARATRDLTPQAALSLADVCFQMGEKERGLSLVSTAMQNAEDETATAVVTRALLQQHGLEAESARLVDQGCEEILKLNNRGVKLFAEDRGAEAAELLMQAADRMPRNRRINLNAAKILLNLMLQKGKNPSYLLRARKYLERLRTQGEQSAEFLRMQTVYSELQQS